MAGVIPANVDAQSDPPVEILPDELTVQSTADIESLRSALKSHIWPQGYPSDRRVDEQVGLNDPTIAAVLDMTNVARIVTYRVRQAYGIDVFVWRYTPKQPSLASMIYHSGHDSTPLSEATLATIPRLMAARVEVVVIGMIVTPYNPEPTVEGRLIQYHSEPWLLPRVDAKHPLHFFLEPTIAGINLLQDEFPGRPVHMMGLSGGGWTTTVMAAIDTRIVRSYPIAGSMPFDVWPDGSLSRAFGRVWRDAEQGSRWQGHTDTYELSRGYRNLYVAGGSGNGRGQTQFIIYHDPCCFWYVDGVNTYAPQVSSRVSAIGSGFWRLKVDTTTVDHTVSLYVVNEILTDLGIGTLPLPPVGIPPTPRVTPVPVPTPTTNPVCPTRLPISLIRIPDAAGVWIGANSSTPIQSLTFTRVTGATVTPPIIQGTNVSFHVSPTSNSWFVGFVLVDGCGPWQTFVGKGS